MYIIRDIKYDDDGNATTVTLYDESVNEEMIVSFFRAKLMHKKEPFGNAILIQDKYFRAKVGKYFTRSHGAGSRGECKNADRRHSKQEDEKREINTDRRGEIQRSNTEEDGFWETIDQEGGADDGYAELEYRSNIKGVLRVCPALRHVAPAFVTKPNVFRNNFEQAKKQVEMGRYVDCHDTDYYKDNCTCLTFRGKGGIGQGFVAITRSGSIISLMRTPDCAIDTKELPEELQQITDFDANEVGFAGQALAQAISNGGNKLDCYVGAKISLGGLYARYGFIPVCRIKFDKNYASADWANTEDYPDVVFFMYCGDKPSVMVENSIICKYPKYSEYKYIPFVDDFVKLQKNYKGLQKENYNDYEFGGFVRNLVQQYYEMQVKTRKDLKSDYTTLVKKLVGELQLN